LAISLASELSPNSIGLDAIEETKVPAIAPGTIKPGTACAIAEATGIAYATSTGLDEFVGLMEKHHSVSIDVAVPVGACTLITPKQKHKYVVAVEAAQTGAGNIGKPVEFSTAEAGAVKDAATLDDKTVGYLARVHDTSDEFTIVRWGK